MEKGPNTRGFGRNLLYPGDLEYPKDLLKSLENNGFPKEVLENNQKLAWFLQKRGDTRGSIKVLDNILFHSENPYFPGVLDDLGWGEGLNPLEIWVIDRILQKVGISRDFWEDWWVEEDEGEKVLVIQGFGGGSRYGRSYYYLYKTTDFQGNWKA